MGIIESIRKGFGIALKCLGLVAVLFVFNLVGNLATLPFTPADNTNVSARAIAPLMIVSVLFVILSIFVQGGSLGLVRDVVKGGKADLVAMPKYGVKFFVRLLLLGLIVLSLVVGLALAIALLVSLTSGLNNPVISGIVLIISLALAIASALYFFIPCILSPYAIVCDEAGAVGAIKKAIETGRKPFVKVFKLLGLVVLLVLIALGVGFLVGLLVGLVSAVLPANASRILMIIVSSAVNSYLGVVATGAFMVYYLGKRETVAAVK